ncbi:MAG: hypothetical protein IPN26_09695 [Bacteroidetes bacterium]|nr:hypothetical protein [Bacteroidota bacterium]
MLFGKEIKLPENATEQLAESNQLLDLITPVVQKVDSNQALYLLGKSWDYLVEYLMYILAALCFGFIFIMHTVFPFHIMDEILHRDIFKNALSNEGDFKTFNLAIKGLVALIAILFIVIGWGKRRTRQHRQMLRETSQTLKKIQNQFSEKQKTLQQLVGQSSTPGALHRVEPKPFTDLPSTQ